MVDRNLRNTTFLCRPALNGGWLITNDSAGDDMPVRIIAALSSTEHLIEFLRDELLAEPSPAPEVDHG